MQALGLPMGDEPAERELMQRRWRARAEHLLGTDPGGLWVVEREGRVDGVAQALVREGVWVLSLLAVDPDLQGRGLGGALLRRALEYGAPWNVGLIAASDDPRAIRLYARAGFALRPTIAARGMVERRRLRPADARVREAGPEALELTAGVSRRLRGATHAPEIAHLMGLGERLLILGDRGFALHDRGSVRMVAAVDEEAARALLWSALAESEPGRPVEVRWIAAEQDWAVEVVLAAGLSLAPAGPLCVWGTRGPMRPFLPSGAFL